MWLYGISNLLTSAASISLGLLVFFKGRGRTRVIFPIFTFIVGGWAFGTFKLCFCVDSTSAMFWSRVLHAFAIFIPPLFLHWILDFLEIKKKKLVLTMYVPSVVFLIAILSFHHLFLTEVSPILAFKYHSKAGILYPFFIIMYGLCVILALHHLVRVHRISSGFKKNQIKYLMVGGIVGFSGGATTFFPMFDIQIFPYGNYFAVSYTILLAYAVLRYRLMDINIVFKKGTVYAILTSSALIPCMLIIVFAQRYYFGETNYAFSSLVFGVLVLAAYFFARMKPITEMSVEKTLFRETYEYKTLLREFSKNIVSFLEEKDLIDSICDTLIQTLRIKGISFLLLDIEKEIYQTRLIKNLSSDKTIELSFTKDNPFFRWLEENDEIVVKEELERIIDNPKIRPIVEMLNSMQSEVCIPLMIRNKLIGIINLGGKESSHMYSHEDIELLGNLARQTAIALENARLYEDLKKSKLIIRRADKLASLGTLTAGLAHEIKNPLVAIKTFVQLLPERFEDEEFRNYFLNVASGEVDRLSDLVNTLLDFARPSQPSFQMGNISEIMDNVLILIENETRRKNLKIEKHYSPDVPLVMLDSEQIKQVFLNMILNATEATPENGFLMVEIKRLDRDGGPEFIQVEIRDTGRGIPKDNLERIFEPFFTTKDNGSGLGLVVSHHIIQEHQGYIEVESEIGKGTSFFINLPVNPLVWRERRRGVVRHH